MVDVPVPTTFAPSRGVSSSFPLVDDAIYLPITPRRQKMGIPPSPGLLESMLKTSTETGDIGIFSIAPKNYRLPTEKYDARELSLIKAMGQENHPATFTDAATKRESLRPPSSCTENLHPYSRTSSLASHRLSRTPMDPQRDQRDHAIAQAQICGRGMRVPMMPNSSGSVNRPRSRPHSRYPHHEQGSLKIPYSPSKSQQPSLNGLPPPEATWHTLRSTSRTPCHSNRSSMPRSQHLYRPLPHHQMSAQHHGYLHRQNYTPYGYTPGPRMPPIDVFPRTIIGGEDWHSKNRLIYGQYGMNGTYLPPQSPVSMTGRSSLPPHTLPPRRNVTPHLPPIVAQEPAVKYSKMVDYIEDAAENNDPSGEAESPQGRKHEYPSTNPYSQYAQQQRGQQSSYPQRRPSQIHALPPSVPLEVYASRAYRSMSIDLNHVGHPGRYFASGPNGTQADSVPKETMMKPNNNKDPSASLSSQGSGSNNKLEPVCTQNSDSASDRSHEESGQSEDFTPSTSTSLLSPCVEVHSVEAQEQLTSKPVVSMMNNWGQGSRICGSSLTIQDQDKKPRTEAADKKLEGFQISFPSLPNELNALKNFKEKKPEPVVIQDESKPSFWSRVTSKFWKSKNSSTSGTLSRSSSFLKFKS